MDIKIEWFDWNDKVFIEGKIQDKPQRDEDKILKYLKSGNPIAACASAIFDLFKPEIRIQTNSYTDTVWDWHDTLIYYVENYHYKVSEEFVNHMRQNNWQVRQLTKDQIFEFCKQRLR